MSKVLIVEDELSIAELEKDYLELSSFEVEIETDGQQGLEKALKNDFDMIILDIMLPGVDGFEICKQIREAKEIPILMVCLLYTSGCYTRTQAKVSGTEKQTQKIFTTSIDKILTKSDVLFLTVPDDAIAAVWELAVSYTHLLIIRFL